MWNRLIIFAFVTVGACWVNQELPGDAVGPGISIGFEKPTSMADEKSSAHMIRIKLSAPSPTDVTVKYQIEGGTASPPADYDIISAETITIPAGELYAPLEVKVKADTDGNEADETIELVLVEPVGAKIAFGLEHHEIVIRAKALPRVAFGTPASSADEPIDATFAVVLDEASEFEITAAYEVTSPNATAGADYVLANGTVTIPVGSLSTQIVLDVVQDALDEDDESVVVTLTNATAALVDVTKDDHTHTIVDEDPMPFAQFATATSTHGEGAGTVTVQVNLSAISGRNVTVPFAIDAAGSNATGGGTDFTLGGGPLVIPAGQPSGTFSVAIVQDTIDEPNETLEIDLAAPTNAMLGTITSHRLQINDDDLVCYGAVPFAVCLDEPPVGTLALPAFINTTSSGLCATAQPTGWTTAPQTQPAACFILKNSITVGSLTVIGSRPLVILAASSLSVLGRVDAGSSDASGSTGPGSPSSECDAFPQAPTASMTGAGGGAGGTFVTKGGNGGTGDGGNATQAGTAPAVEATPLSTLRAGCNGQRGGNNSSGAAGRGGGAIYLVTGGTLTLGASSVINVSGSAGSAGSNFSGGSGGGSGGMIKLFAQTLTATTGATIVSNGAGGSSGGDGGGPGANGSDPDPATPMTPASGGIGGGGNGGAGFAGASQATNGNNAGNARGGGGGGGGGGYVQSNKALTNVTVSAGVVQVP